MTPSGASGPPEIVDNAYAPPSREGVGDIEPPGRRQGNAALVCAPIAVVILALTIGVTRATQSTAAGMVGCLAAALVAFVGAALGISALAKLAMGQRDGRLYAGAVFCAALLNGLLALAGGMLAFALLVVSD